MPAILPTLYRYTEQTNMQTHKQTSKQSKQGKRKTMSTLVNPVKTKTQQSTKMLKWENNETNKHSTFPTKKRETSIQKQTTGIAQNEDKEANKLTQNCWQINVNKTACREITIYDHSVRR